MSSQKFLQQIERQSILTRNRMIVEAMKRGKEITRTGNLVSSIQNNMKVAKKNGIPFKVRFGFEVQGSYVSVGVGRGTTIAQALANQSKREKVNWYKPIILAQIPTYGELWTQYWAKKLMEELTTELDKLEK